eukprot:GILJ01009315.1.p1 GENE.GILJ01009315.1~~GILJ01009315.1.p1  ORF type:complete len:271 (+),score=37.95 GILJ01009315.1:279-1091(+)
MSAADPSCTTPLLNNELSSVAVLNDFDKKSKPVETDISGSLFARKDEYSDITFEVGNQKLYAHKSVLFGRSPKLDLLFQTSLSQGGLKSNTYQVTSPCTAADFAAMLEFIYTGAVNWETHRSCVLNPSTLLALAKEYGLPALMAECDKHLTEKLSHQMLHIDDQFCFSLVQAYLMCSLYHTPSLRRLSDSLLAVHADRVQRFIFRSALRVNLLFENNEGVLHQLVRLLRRKKQSPAARLVQTNRRKMCLFMILFIFVLVLVTALAQLLAD